VYRRLLLQLLTVCQIVKLHMRILFPKLIKV
jgi:hypothetical protein